MSSLLNEVKKLEALVKHQVCDYRFVLCTNKEQTELAISKHEEQDNSNIFLTIFELIE